MGTFQVAIEVGDPQGQRWQSIEALVDTAATYTWVPAPILESLGVQPAFRFPFITPDGRCMEREVAETRVRLDGQVRTTLVVFGDAGTRPLLGAYTMEGFGVAADPLNRRLVPVPGLLL